MQVKKRLTILTILIALLSSLAASIGIFNTSEHEAGKITTVRGTEVQLYGKGVYFHMSAEVAPQGIAQDAVTLFIGIPLVVISLLLYRKGSLMGQVLMTGTLGYFLVTYLFFTMMAMYNQLFLLWVVLLSLSFYAFVISFRAIEPREFVSKISTGFPVKTTGYFLMVTAIVIGALWLSIVVPPLITGTIPTAVEHYTTLVVQALDLSILLPASFIAGFLLIKRNPGGYKLASIYIVFLSILMTALTAKIVAMAILGYTVIPAIFIIPAFNLISVICMILSLRSINHQTEIKR
jgi:hypothetical protein